jgi:hypothetical protein
MRLDSIWASLIKAGHVGHIRGLVAARAAAPQRQYARAQGAVFGHELNCGISGQQACLGVGFGGRVLMLALANPLDLAARSWSDWGTSRSAAKASSIWRAWSRCSSSSIVRAGGSTVRAKSSHASRIGSILSRMKPASRYVVIVVEPCFALFRDIRIEGDYGY